jgi:hypothetical protein
MAAASGLEVLLTNGRMATLRGNLFCSATVGAGGEFSILKAQEVLPPAMRIADNMILHDFCFNFAR